MPDMTCPRCGEPSDVTHVRHEMTAPLPPSTWEGRARTLQINPEAMAVEADGLLPEMPEPLLALTRAAMAAEAEMENVLRHPARPIPDSVFDPAEEAARAANEAWRAEMYRVGLRYGCDCCLLEPERRTDSEENLRRALFDSAWDGDPAVILS